jgi:dUTP pyrophosphatase
MISLRVKKLNPNAVIPKFQTDGAAGMDLTATTRTIEQIPSEDGHVYATCKYTYGTDLAFEIPEGHVGLLFPRSSIQKTDLRLSNCVGVIDSDYRGEVKLVFFVRSNSKRSYEKVYKIGDRVGQLVILKLPEIEIKEVEELSETIRGVGGFGSTGN